LGNFDGFILFNVLVITI